MKKKNQKSAVRPKPVANKRQPAAIKKSSRKIDFYFVAMGLVIVSISLLRLRLIEIPLERDEGEYGYIGKLILDGVAPYKEAYNMKLPGTYSMYAMLMAIFGKSITGIHFGLLIMNAATMLFLFLGFRKLFNSSIALFAASVYGLMAVSPAFLGFAAHATHFVNFFVSLGIFFLARFYDKKNFVNVFLIGLMFGLSFLMKQQSVFFLLFAGIAILVKLVSEKPIKILPVLLLGSVYVAGVLIPYGLTVLILKFAGAFDKFWFWTVTYASKYASGVSFSAGKKLFAYSFNSMWGEFKIFWILFFSGLVLLFLTRFSVRQKFIAISFAFFGFLTVCPGFYFRQHYFISFLPAVGLLAAISIDYLAGLLGKVIGRKSMAIVPFIVFVVIFISTLKGNEFYYLKGDPNEICKTFYGSNPFVESIEISKYIKENSAPQDKFAVLGSEPQLFLYADRHSATGYIYTYGLMEAQSYNKKMQEEMIAEIEKNNPKFLVFCGIGTSWLRQPESPMLIFDWFDKFSKEKYSLSGVADIYSDRTIYKWDNEVNNYQIKSNTYILIYKRK